MVANILYGKPISEQIKKQVAKGIQYRLENNLSEPGLAVILVGDNSASKTYIKHKKNACKQVGIISKQFNLPENASEDVIKALIQQLNEDTAVHGILLQLPLPKPEMVDRLLECIDPNKDVDGFHPYNMGKLALRQPLLRPCTPWGVIKLLESTKVDLCGKHAVIIGASNIVGRPMSLELLLKKCTTTTCHRHTQHLAAIAREADILISATGIAKLIKGSWVKPGAMVIDVGFSHLSNGQISGDVDFEAIKEHASWITPVPGGVGLMTVAMLLNNTLTAANLIDDVHTTPLNTVCT